MKIACLCFMCMLSCIAGAQKIYTVIDGYTLEPVQGYTVHPSSIRITIEYVFDDGFTVKMMNKGDSICVAGTGYQPQTLFFSDYALNYNAQYIVLQPTDSLRACYNERYFPGVRDSVKAPTIYGYTDKAPAFPGGPSAMRKFISENLKYPRKEHELGITGKVITEFIVEADGSVRFVSIAKGGSYAMALECNRVILKMPKWEPGTINGKPVRSRMFMPFNFTLK